ncbi:MAG: collagen-like protein, partial [Methylococcaceae bacterium]|nr:collagen-like protein [Methylococcaceae bacterium]
AGPQGLKGAMGPQGIQGLKGDVGARGIQGERGLPGEMGLPGKQGLQGVPGVQGPIGLTGQQGPKGDVGATGPQGEQGPVGPQSLSSSIYRDQRSYVLPAYSYKTLETMCGPEYPNLLGGGCGHRDDNDVQTDIVVNYAGPSPTNPRVWRCMVDNGNQFRSRTVLIYTICAK